jgi:uracil-DNA glycosylase family 4
MQDLLTKYSIIKECKECDLYKYNPEGPIIGYGDPKSPLWIVSEAPGASELWTRIPLCGINELKESKCAKCSKVLECYSWFLTGKKSIVGHNNCPGYNEAKEPIDLSSHTSMKTGGQELDKLLEHLKIERKSIFTTNVIYCRPLNNATPLPEHYKVCVSKNLDPILDYFKPKVIITMGLIPSTALTGVKTQKESLINQYKYKDSIILCTYHPAKILRFRNFSSDAEKKELSNMLNHWIQSFNKAKNIVEGK